MKIMRDDQCDSIELLNLSSRRHDALCLMHLIPDAHQVMMNINTEMFPTQGSNSVKHKAQAY